jgi:hypothetical protein
MGYSIEELKYIAKVEELLVERARMHDDFNEVDFLCGAMVYFDDGNGKLRAPAYWILGPLAGRNVVEIAKERIERRKLLFRKF